MESNTTYLFDVSEIDNVLVEETIKEVYESLEEKGYNAVNQIVGYLISGDPGYISSYNDSRKKISKLERTQIVEVLLRNYMKK
ncbi:MAG: IreB family regulatory phosphoprotein [Bacilli bacterium]|nr:IreB family regulatory phosphoprotein [Bacilli bacterium]